MLKRLMILLMLLAPLGAYAGGCGLRPLTPLGCDRESARCVCDKNGRNCHWQFEC